MDLELELATISTELSRIDSIVKELTSLKNNKFYEENLDSISALIKQLKAKKKQLHTRFNEITYEAYSIATAIEEATEINASNE